ncbi:MAG: alanine racemase [Candidatus Helarchaeota archaeon]|nr:alanine racemase [Candidatus Helarchaeota archaeon]
MKTKISGNPIATIRQNEAYIDGFSTKNLVKKFGTPLFVYSENKIRSNCSNFSQIFKKLFPNLLVLYSFKANYLPQICEIIKSEEIGAETVTSFELESAIKLRFDPKKIHLGGVYLPEDILKIAFRNGIGLISICSLTQLNTLIKLTEDIDKTQNIGIRIVSPKFDRRIGFAPNKETFMRIIDSISKSPNLKLTTLHSHYGTQMMEPSIFSNNAKYILDAASLMEEAGVNVSQLNLGGGFPEATIMNNIQLEKIGKDISQFMRERGYLNLEIVFEPGRYIVGDAGILLASVIDLNFQNQRWIYLDAGTNICPIWANSNLRFFCANKISSPHNLPINIAGPLPTYMDVLAKKTPFIKNVEINDTLIILNVGAYNLSWGTLFPFSQPPYVLIKNNQLVEIRPRKNPSFIL